MSHQPVTPLSPGLERVPVDLTWDKLTYTVQVKDDETGKMIPKVLLKTVSGTARRARTLAVMGPSGAGKSTFLNGICGRLAINKDQVLDGTAYLNDTLFLTAYKPLISYVAQDDIVMGKDTAREALTFSYRLRSGASAEEAEVRVNEVLEQLSLTKCADVLLGIPGLIKGVSGGEKKRVNIGSELINNPMILLLDEPTTGLDSVNALRVGLLLRDLAHDDLRTVICTIHSPSSELYAVFDDILLFAKGWVIYHGPCVEAPAYFASIGHPVPARVNPSEHFMTLLQGAPEALKVLADNWLAHVASDAAKTNLSVNQTPTEIQENGNPALDAIIKHRTVSGFVEMGLLTGRSWRTTMRDPAGTFGKIIQALFFAVLLALFFANLKKTDAGVSDRAGVLFMEVMNLTFLNVMSAIATFPPERAVFLMEQSNSMYSAVRYYWSKVFAEIPLSLFVPTLYVIVTYWSWGLTNTAVAFFNHYAIVLCLSNCGMAFGLFAASLFPKPEIAMTLTPLMLMPMMIVGGLFANTERLEPYWVWLNYISFPRYAYKGFMVNEFEHVGDLCDGGNGNCQFLNGAEAINYYGFTKNTDTVWFTCVLLIIIMFAFRVIGSFGLWVQGAAARSELVFEPNYRKAGKSAVAARPAANAVEMAPKEPVAAN